MRALRGESSTGYYHVMNRGINGMYLFREQEEKQKLLEVMREAKEDVHIAVVSYCVMDNHLHLLVKAEKDNLILYMRKIGIRYAMYYNRKEKRRGAVFQDRFKSEQIEDEAYLLSALRYIHNNPVKARMVAHFDDYGWSSAGQYLDAFSVQEPNYLKELGIGEGIGQIEVETEELKWLRERYGSHKAFLQHHMEEDWQVHLDTDEEMKRQNLDKAQWLIQRACRAKGLVEMPKKGGGEIKAEICQMLIQDTDLSAREIGGLLGISKKQVLHTK